MSVQKFVSKDIGEIIPLDFRFPEFSGEDPIINAIVTAEVWEATGGAADAAPQAIVYGDAERHDSAVQQTIAGGVAGITYLITCKATTAAGYVRIKRGTIAVTGIIVPSAVPPAVTIVPFSGVSVGTIIYDDVEIVASPGEINYLSGVTSALQSQLDGKAPLISPQLTGTPTTPTAALGTSTTQIASTAFVAAQIAASSPGLAPVQSVAGRTGVVVLSVSDVAGAAPLASPTFSGTVGGITKGMVGLGNVDDTSDAAKPISTLTQAALDLKAPLNNPTLTGTLTTPDIRFNGTTSVGFVPKSLTTAQRNAIASPPAGATIWNTTDTRTNYYDGTAWRTHARLEGDTFTGTVAFNAGITGASNVLEVRNGTNAQLVHIYRSFTDALNYGRLTINANSASILFNAAGTGIGTTLTIGTATNNSLFFQTNGSNVWQMTGSGVLQPVATNTVDLGASGNRVRAGYFGTVINVAGAFGTNAAILVNGSGATDRAAIYLSPGDGTTSNRTAYVQTTSNETAPQTWRFGMNGDKDWTAFDITNSRTPLRIAADTGLVTFALGVSVPSATGITSSGVITANVAGIAQQLVARNTDATSSAAILISSGDGTTSSRNSYVRIINWEGAVNQEWRVGTHATTDFAIKDINSSRTPISVAKADGLVTFANGASIAALTLTGLSIYADNAAATAGGLAAGRVYRTATGVLMVRY